MNSCFIQLILCWNISECNDISNMIVLHLEQYGWISRRDVDLINGNFHNFEVNIDNTFSNDANFELERNANDISIEEIHINGYQCVVKEIHINPQILLAIGRG